MHLANFILFYISTSQISSIDREQKMHLVLIFSSTCTDNIADYTKFLNIFSILVIDSK